MTLLEAQEKADQALEMGLIEPDQYEAYIDHLLKTYNE